MADLDPEDIMSEAEEDMAGANLDDPVDGEAEKEGAKVKEEQIPQNLHGYWQKSTVKDSDIQAMKARALWPLRPSPDGGLTSRPQCLLLTPPKL
jgi:hypothetical protein